MTETEQSELDLAPEIWVDIHENGGIYLDHGDERGKVGYPGQTRAEIAARFPTIIAPKEVGENGWWKYPSVLNLVMECFDRVEKL